MNADQIMHIKERCERQQRAIVELTLKNSELRKENAELRLQLQSKENAHAHRNEIHLRRE